MARRVRLTVFSRFLIVMMILIPLAYLGASYFNGQDGVENIKSLFNSTTEENNASLPTPNHKVDQATTQSSLEQQIDALKKENIALKKEVASLKTQIADLKARN